MRGVLNKNGYSPVDHMADGGVSKAYRVSSSPTYYYDDGKRISVTVTKFCREIQNNFALSFPRRIRGMTFPACEFNLVSHMTGQCLSYIFPLSGENISSLAVIEVTSGKAGVRKLRSAIETAEPTILAHQGQNFGLLQPTNAAVVNKILELMKIPIPAELAELVPE